MAGARIEESLCGDFSGKEGEGLLPLPASAQKKARQREANGPNIQRRLSKNYAAGGRPTGSLATGQRL